MSSSGSGSIHVFVESYDFTIIYCEHMRKVTPELPTRRFDTPSVMTKSHDFITLSEKLSWIKMLNPGEQLDETVKAGKDGDF